MIENVLKSIPSFLSKVVCDIFVVCDGIIYEVTYTGDKIQYKEIDKCIYASIDATTTFNNKKVFVFQQDDSKVIITMDIYSLKSTLEGKKTILIADDSDLVVNFFERIFADEYNILKAQNGIEAIEIMESATNIDCLLLDLLMPLSSGFEVLKYMREHDLFNSIPVSIISGDDSKDSISKVSEYPIVDILNKPFSVDAAKNLVNKMI